MKKFSLLSGLFAGLIIALLQFQISLAAMSTDEISDPMSPTPDSSLLGDNTSDISNLLQESDLQELSGLTPKHNYIKCKPYPLKPDEQPPKGITVQQLQNQGVDVQSAINLSVSCKVVSPKSVQINTKYGSKTCPLFTKLPAGARPYCGTAVVIYDHQTKKLDIRCTMHEKSKSCTQVAQTESETASDTDGAQSGSALKELQKGSESTETSVKYDPGKSLERESYKTELGKTKENNPYSQLEEIASEQSSYSEKQTNPMQQEQKNPTIKTSSDFNQNISDLRDPLKRRQYEYERIQREVYAQNNNLDNKDRHPAGFSTGNLYIVPIIRKTSGYDEFSESAFKTSEQYNNKNLTLIEKAKQAFGRFTDKLAESNETSFAVLHLKSNKKPSEFDQYLNLKAFDNELLKNISYLEKETAIFVAEQALEKAKYITALEKANTPCAENQYASRCVLERIKNAEKTQFEIFKSEIEKSPLSEATKQYLIEMYIENPENFEQIKTPLERYLQNSKQESALPSAASQELLGEKEIEKQSNNQESIWDKLKKLLGF